MPSWDGAAPRRRVARLRGHICSAGAPALTWTAALAAEQPFRPGPLSEEQVRGYWRAGFVVVPVPPDLGIGALRAEAEALVELNAQRLVKEGRLSPADLHEGVGLDRRQALIEGTLPGSSFELFTRSCNGTHSRFGRSAAARALQSHPVLLDMVQQLTGAGDISLTGAFSLRAKCPNRLESDQVGASGGVWHQDIAYLLPEAEDSVAVTIWLPIAARDITAEMGAMQYERGGHRRAHADGGRTLPHHVGWGTGEGATAYMQLDQDPAGEHVTVEVPQGHMILSSNIIPHRGLENRSDVMRWSIDIRFQDARLPAGIATVPVRRAGDPSFVPDFRPTPGPSLQTARLHPWTLQKLHAHKRQAELQAERRRRRGKPTREGLRPAPDTP